MSEKKDGVWTALVCLVNDARSRIARDQYEDLGGDVRDIYPVVLDFPKQRSIPAGERRSALGVFASIFDKIRVVGLTQVEKDFAGQPLRDLEELAKEYGSDLGYINDGSELCDKP